MKHKVIQYCQLVAGSILFSLSVCWFLNPDQLNSGGIIGFAQILSWLVTRNHPDITGILNLCLNIPLFLLAWRKISGSFCIKTLLSIAIQTICLQVIPPLSQPVMDTVLANALLGGILGGAGIGLCLRSAGCAGGMDILGMYLAQTRPDFSVGKLCNAVNVVVLSLSAWLFDLQTALYSLIFVVIAYTVSDAVHIQNINVWALVFTTNPDLKREIGVQMTRGVTWWKGKGAWTDKDEEVLVTAINKYEVRKLRKICQSMDPDCFLIINDGDPVQGNFQKRLLD